MKKISPNDKKRIMRVLEIYEATGKNKTEQEAESRLKEIPYNYKVFAITMDREKLYERIETADHGRYHCRDFSVSSGADGFYSEVYSGKK